MRNQILESARAKERTWSMKGFDLRALIQRKLEELRDAWAVVRLLWRDAEDLGRLDTLI